MGLFSKIFKTTKIEKRFPPIPEWRPNTPIDFDKILEAAKYYTDSKYQLGVFKYGTVAFFSTTVENIAEQSKICIDKIYNFHPDFNPTKMDDGNYHIQYSQPAFTIVFNDEIKNYWNYIDKNHLKGICTDEVLIDGEGRINTFNEIGKISLFARAKMFMDAQDPEIIRTFNPSFWS